MASGKTFAFLLVLFLTAAAGNAAEVDKSEQRPAQFAGSFYPAKKADLRVMIRKLLDEAHSGEERDREGELLGLVVPHAGYVYSGNVAAKAYTMLERANPDTVILLGPSHRVPFEGASVWSAGAWQTPLGEVPVDRELAEAIRRENKSFDRPILPHFPEHSLEVQMPFLQTVLPETPVVPILVSDSSQENCMALARAIYRAVLKSGKRVVYIVSTDLSHYKDLATTERMDAVALDAITKGDSRGLARSLGSKSCEMCGQAATLTLLEIMRYYPGARASRLSYDTSATAKKDEKRVVGYASLAFRDVSDPSFELSEKQKTELLGLARKSIEYYLQTKEYPVVSTEDSSLKIPRGVFVTLLKDGVLRGCVGFPEAVKPLYEAVSNRAIASGFHDPRFKGLSSEELEKIRIKISVLSEPVPISGPGEIILGQDGIIVQHSRGAGLFLPYVATELGWDKPTMLEQLCKTKARLPSRCWELPGTRLYKFGTLDFAESQEDSS